MIGHETRGDPTRPECASPADGSGVTEAMDALLEKVATRVHGFGDTARVGWGDERRSVKDDYRSFARCLLAAIVPDVRKQAGEEIAEAIENRGDALMDAVTGMPADNYYAAAKVAREIGGEMAVMMAVIEQATASERPNGKLYRTAPVEGRPVTLAEHARKGKPPTS